MTTIFTFNWVTYIQCKEMLPAHRDFMRERWLWVHLLEPRGGSAEATDTNAPGASVCAP
jgi:hypothetical protein